MAFEQTAEIRYITIAKARNVEMRYTESWKPTARLELEVGVAELAATGLLEAVELRVMLDKVLLPMPVLEVEEPPGSPLAVFASPVFVADVGVGVPVAIIAVLPPIALTSPVSVEAAEIMESKTDAPMTIEAAPPRPV